LCLAGGERRQPVHRGDRVVSVQLQIALNEAKKARIVIDDENGGSLGIHHSFP
jgi:hypothetical protein